MNRSLTLLLRIWRNSDSASNRPSGCFPVGLYFGICSAHRDRLHGLYVMIALSINLLTGFLGVMTLGQAAFYGICAYTAAILSTRIGLGMGLSMVVAAVIAGVFSLLLGLPTMRLKGYFMTVVTLGFCEIIRLVEMNWMHLVALPRIAGIPAPEPLWD